MGTRPKRKLRASKVIDRKELKKTNPKVLLAEMERICTPKLNRLVEREQFKHLEQDEEESISDFEARVRSKAFLCYFNRCKSGCKDNCLAQTTCGFSREEDEIMTQILCRMKDKDLQKDLWMRNKEFESLDKVLATIRASEAARDSQAAFGSESGSADFRKIKCHKCGKWGHGQRDCKEKEEKLSSKCSFCGGSQQYQARLCKAYKAKCPNCNMFGHFKFCCTDFTKSRARKDWDKGISKVEDDMVQANHLHLHHVRRKEEKKIRQQEKKALDRTDVNKTTINESSNAEVTPKNVNDIRVTDENKTGNTEVVNNR